MRKRTFPVCSFVYALLDIKAGCMSIENKFRFPLRFTASLSQLRLKTCVQRCVLSPFASSLIIFVSLRPCTPFHCASLHITYTRQSFPSLHPSCLFVSVQRRIPYELVSSIVRKFATSQSLLCAHIVHRVHFLYICFWCCALHRPSDFQV